MVGVGGLPTIEAAFFFSSSVLIGTFLILVEVAAVRLISLPRGQHSAMKREKKESLIFGLQNNRVKIAVTRDTTGPNDKHANQLAITCRVLYTCPAESNR